MKTTQHNQVTSNFKVKSKLILIAVMLITSTLLSQEKPRFGLVLNTITTGNGHGLIFSPGIMVSKGNSLLSLEMNIQKRQGNITGSQLNYEYSIYNGTSPTNVYCDRDLFDVFLYVNARYNQNQLLGENQIRVEKRVEPESSVKFENIKLNTAEMYVGFGVRTKITKHLKWVNSIGIGGYTTLNNSTVLYRENSSICLSLKTGISYGF